MWWSMMRTPESAVQEVTDLTTSELTEDVEDAQEEVTAPIAIVPDSTNDIQLQNQYASFASSASGVESFQTLENDRIKLTFSNKGGRIVSAVLKDYKQFQKNENGKEELKGPVTLLDNERNKFEYILDINNKSISTGDLYFEPIVSGSKITYRATTTSGGVFQQTYNLNEDSYEVGYDLNIKGLQNELNRSRPFITLNWSNVLNAIETNEMWPERYSSVYFKPQDDDSDYCNCMSDDVEEKPDAKIEWVSHAHQFFNTSLIALDRPFGGGVFSTQMLEDKNELKVAGTNLEIPYGHGSEESLAMTMYIGPNEYENLRAFDNDLEEIIPFGRSIFGDINRVVIRLSLIHI